MRSGSGCLVDARVHGAADELRGADGALLPAGQIAQVLAGEVDEAIRLVEVHVMFATGGWRVVGPASAAEPHVLPGGHEAVLELRRVLRVDALALIHRRGDPLRRRQPPEGLVVDAVGA